MKKLVIFFACLIAMGSFAWAQDCPDGCIELSTGNVYTLNQYLPDCEVDVEYSIYDCGGVRTIKITNITVIEGCGGWTNFSIYHYNINSLEEYISLGLIQATAGSLPGCPGGSQNIKIYTAQCGIWVGCTYAVTGDPLSCDPGYELPYPHIPGTPSTVKVYKWQPCGTICCENVYSLCQDPTSAVVTITKVHSGPQGSSTCSGQATYAPRPCQNGCM